MPPLPEKSTADLPTVEVRTGARLHFGLLDTGAPFGGIGLMIDQPATRIAVQAAEGFSVAGPDGAQTSEQAGLQQRVTDVVERFARLQGLPGMPAVRIAVVERPAAHSGLGTGTQLAMAVAAGLNHWFDTKLPPQTIMQDIAARGLRSGVGSHGFFSGGLVIDALPPRSLPVPDSWRVVLLRPHQAPAAVSGCDENQRFATMQQGRVEQRRVLEALLTDELEPLARTGRFEAFASAVRQYNWLSGKLFESSQGGAYNGPEITRLVEEVRQLGYQGVGQSSWGPTVFALCATAAEAERLVASPPSMAVTAVIAAPLNSAAVIQ